MEYTLEANEATEQAFQRFSSGLKTKLEELGLWHDLQTGQLRFNKLGLMAAKKLALRVVGQPKIELPKLGINKMDTKTIWDNGYALWEMIEEEILGRQAEWERAQS